ncbi:hypothetical protein [Vibrio algivorus]|uniref:RiboL-PSP-HEPN domain-containing protein n=1 Tax=Vibrio algivorus TaxID=1667024 RepID=A0A557NUQ1_9VIBR|nr:hypothetical protein [Vibrio algivorus]TVO32146.1 hypothetical protein FOF44_17425 [Vibrio algivorus]
MKGRSKGTVYAHTYFSASVERTLSADNFGDQCAGLTSVALTAFMVESYLNYLCENIYLVEVRTSKYLDDNSQEDIVEVMQSMESVDKELPFNVRLAEVLGYKAQSDIMMKSLRKSVHKKQRESFDQDLLECREFNFIESKYKFSAQDKLKAVLKACDTSQSEYDKLLQENNKLFYARNALAHGRTEYVDTTFKANDDLSVPTVNASWQEQCTLAKAKAMYKSSKELIDYLNEKFLFELQPLNRLSSQISAVS